MLRAVQAIARASGRARAVPVAFSRAAARSLSTHVERDPRFGTLTDEDVAYFRDVLGDVGVIQGAADLDNYNTCDRLEKKSEAHGLGRTGTRRREEAEGEGAGESE